MDIEDSDGASIARRTAADAGLGLDSEDEDAEPKRAVADNGLGLDSDDEASNPRRAVADDGLGLDSDDEDAEPKRAVADDGLGLDSDDDEAPPSAPMGDDGLGLSDSEEDDSTQTAAPSNEAKLRESKTNVYRVPANPRPSSSATIHLLKVPPQLNVEAEEFGFTRPLSDLRVGTTHSLVASIFLWMPCPCLLTRRMTNTQLQEASSARTLVAATTYCGGTCGTKPVRSCGMPREMRFARATPGWLGGVTDPRSSSWATTRSISVKSPSQITGTLKTVT
jgi:hypothetical protein